MVIDKGNAISLKGTLESLPAPSLMPSAILEAQKSLLKEFEAEALAPNTRTKMVLISKALRLFAAQYMIEAAHRTKALTVVMAARHSERRRLNG